MSFFSCYDVVKVKNTKNRPTQYLKQTKKVAGSYGSLSNLGNFFLFIFDPKCKNCPTNKQQDEKPCRAELFDTRCTHFFFLNICHNCF